ncbi:hypothetical protein Nepgr_008909 [Nepenthes gracilis]|uniref:Uncharacterized protein n=1 Tax=Nepenthes gracilis TaxID=150966 RepID=A0AAD3S9Z3_NEPGR|nr:hypothetical protein Nepgr_008909 [Nepenthes gracilis]
METVRRNGGYVENCTGYDTDRVIGNTEYNNSSPSITCKVFPVPSFPPPSSSSTPVRSIEHIVSKMDTLAGIAIKYGVEVADIKRKNGLVTDRQMFALKTLQIPLPGRHPPSSCLSNGSDSAGPSNSEQTPPRRRSDLFESFQSLRTTPETKASPAMSSLQGFYGLKSSGRRNSSEGFEMAVYSQGSNDSYLDAGQLPRASLNPPFRHHRKSRSLANGLMMEDREPRNLVPPRQCQTPEKLMNAEKGKGGWFSAIAGKGLALRTKAFSRINLASEAESIGTSTGSSGPGNSAEADGLLRVRKSSSTPSFQDQEDGSGSSNRPPPSKWSLKPDLQALSTSAIAKPIIDGLSKPITASPRRIIITGDGKSFPSPKKGEMAFGNSVKGTENLEFVDAMAPGRKRGANKGKATNELCLGDLVLAKVKGFPAWPAKVSRPEEWERAPDPKKYFVQFFGTQEIAFVAPADIQAFTCESKSKLLARCQGKTVKYFAQAVREICEAFTKLQQKKSGGLDNDSDQTTIPYDSSRVNSLEIDGFDTVLRKRNETEEAAAIGSGGGGRYELDCCSHMQVATDSRDKKSMVLCEQCFVSSSAFTKKSSDDDEDAPRGELSMYAPRIPSHFKENVSDTKNREEFSICGDRIDSGRALSSSTYSGSCDLEGNSNHGLEGGKRDNSSASFGVFCAKIPVGRMKPLMDGHKPKELDVGSKRKFDDADRHNDDTGSSVLLKDGKPRKLASVGSNRKSFPDAQKFISCPRGKTVKDLHKDKKQVHVYKKSQLQKDVVGNSKYHAKGDHYGQKKSGQLGHEKKILGANERSLPAKRPENAELVNDSARGSILKNGKNDLPASNVTVKKFEKNAEIKELVHVKAEVDLGIKAEKGKLETDTCSGEAILHLAKCCKPELEAMSDPKFSTTADQKNSIYAFRKNDKSKKRRAICLYYNDGEDDNPKTPVHGGSVPRVNAPLIHDFTNSSNDNHEFLNYDGQCLKGSGGDRDCSPSECIVSAKSLTESSLPTTLLQTALASEKTHPCKNPGELEPKKQLLKDTKTVSVTPNNSPKIVDVANKLLEVQRASSHSVPPKKSPGVLVTASKVVEEQKASRHSVKGSGAGTQIRAQTASVRASLSATDRLNSSKSQIATMKSKLLSSGDRPKGTPKTNSRFIEFSASVENQRQKDSIGGGRLEDVHMDITSNASDSVMPLKNLIAAARHAQMRSLMDGSGNSILALTADMQGRSPSPSSTQQPFLFAAKNVVQVDAHGTHSQTNFVSPPSHVHQFASEHQFDTEDHEDRRLSSGHRTAGGSLSGGTEAIVARDAFEGMIETLSRTKESIGRATRLAVDCAKYGIANEVMDILIRKLDTEPSLHRRVDLFFLVDSITQCSHSQKGIAGASYIPAVQAALPQFLAAAAPPGANAQENRRQCYKVLRLWLERKILPESVLRQYMDDIGAANNDTTSGFSHKHPSRVERGVDDPIRQMEGMLVDEYGSNATFQLPGFLSSHAFNDDEEDEEDGPGSSCKGAANASPMGLGHTLRESETERVAPSDRRHHSLEDVDDELEMEDTSTHLKEEGALCTNESGQVMQEKCLDRVWDPATIGSADASSLEGSPPLPLEPPPLLPPLPPSPPSPSPPPSSPIPPLPSSFPPPLPSQPPPFISPRGPTQSGHFPPPLPPQCPQSTYPSRVLPLPPASLPSSSPQLAYQMPVPHECHSMSNGNPPVETVGNPPRQLTWFAPSGIAGPQEPAGYNSAIPLEHGHKEMYISSQAARPNQHFEPGHMPFINRPFCQATPPQAPASHLPINNSTVPQHSYPHPHSSPYLPNGQSQYVADEHWRASSGGYKGDNQHGTWMNGGRTPSCSTTGYFRPTADGLPANSKSFQLSAPNPLSAAGPAAGHDLDIKAVSPRNKTQAAAYETKKASITKIIVQSNLDCQFHVQCYNNACASEADKQC